MVPGFEEAYAKARLAPSVTKEDFAKFYAKTDAEWDPWLPNWFGHVNPDTVAWHLKARAEAEASRRRIAEKRQATQERNQQ